MNFIVKYPKPLDPNKTAFTVVEAANEKHAELYVKWMHNLDDHQVKAICETNTKPEFHATAEELKDLELI